MYRFVLILIVVVSCLAGQQQAGAQNLAEAVPLSHYVFDQFREAQVKLKSGEAYGQLMNYNILTGEFIFQKDGAFLAISNPAEVDTVYIENRRFVPVNKKFYELLFGSNPALLREFTCKVLEPGVATGYGGNSNTTAASSYKSLVGSGGAYYLKLPDDFKVKTSAAYWIRTNGDYQKLANLKQLSRIIPAKKEQIEEYVKKNNPAFNSGPAMIALMKATQ